MNPYIPLLEKEEWEIKNNKVYAYGKEFPITHPFSIYCKLFREETNPELKFTFMKSIHDKLWPQYKLTWNPWIERMFRTYCEGWETITWAGGSSIGKSDAASKIGLIEYIAGPKNTAVLVASTTLDALDARVYGYFMRYMREQKLFTQYKLLHSKPSKILHDRADLIHCIAPMAAAKGTDKEAIKNYIGRHPKRKLLLILDEAPDLDLSILDAQINLEAGDVNFQIIAIGNSSEKDDLHGVLSTPKGGWKSVDPMKHNKWETTQRNGICLFFSCYESPALFEKDEKKKKALSKFLPTELSIEKAKIKYGEKSDKFYRFMLGFWKTTTSTSNLISELHAKSYSPDVRAELSGITPLHIVGGLDPAFSTGGDQCVLRLAVLGTDINGNVVLDYKRDKLLFRIPILAISNLSAEKQIAAEVLKILAQFKCPLSNICVDANGQGRGIADVLHLSSNEAKPPIKIWSVKQGSKAVNSFDVVIKTSFELWYEVRKFIESNQIRGMDDLSLTQLHTRKFLQHEKTHKMTLESKADYKRNAGAINPSLAFSPDEMDAAALCLQSAILNFGFSKGQVVNLGRQLGFHDEKAMMFQNQQRAAQVQAQRKQYVPLVKFGASVNTLAGKSMFNNFAKPAFHKR